MQYKLLLLDIDGTLTESRGDALPSKRVIEAVKAAQKHVTVAVATGRPREFAQPVLDALQLHGFGIFNGGSEIIDTTSGKLVFEQLLSVEQLRELARLGQPFGYKIYSGEDQYSVPLTSPEQITKPTTKFFVEAVKIADIPAMIDELNGVAGVFAHPTTSWEGDAVMDVHVTHELATKRHGAEELQRIAGAAKEEVMAIGDGHNDIPLLEAAGLKIAMGNAPDEVKAVADYIAPALSEDGVAEAIERFILS